MDSPSARHRTLKSSPAKRKLSPRRKLGFGSRLSDDKLLLGGERGEKTHQSYGSVCDDDNDDDNDDDESHDGLGALPSASKRRLLSDGKGRGGSPTGSNDDDLPAKPRSLARQLAGVLVPAMIGFAHVIFRDERFDAYMPSLLKLVLLSAAVHQLAFTLKSSLKFAVGQVQDAGLIFLCAMTTTIVAELGGADGENMDTVVATTLFALALSTVLLGLALVLTGHMQLASLVQYLPMPVVGGYLAFIGLFCLLAGLSMMTGKPLSGVQDLGVMLDSHTLVLATPGILCGLALLVLVTQVRHWATLPVAMVSIPVLFFMILLASGHSMEDARAFGWVSPLSPSPPVWDAYAMFQPSLVSWSIMPKLIPTWLGMYFVVAFSSSLDVAAIEMDMGSQLDFNHELKTVGWSNLLSGLTGGFTGSYIFSQTIFTARTGLDSRINGIVIICIEVGIALLPVSVISYVPKLFFGSVLVFIGFDLMLEWLWASRHKVLPTGYAVVWVTFFAINITGLEWGIVVGCVVSAFRFVLEYSSQTLIEQRHVVSNVVRSFADQSVLSKAHQEIVAIRIRGFIFFGTSIRVIKDVKKYIMVGANKSLADLEHEQECARNGRKGSDDMMESGLMSLQTSSPHWAQQRKRTKYLILDFFRVTGLDATAVRACFLSLQVTMARHNVTIVYANVTPVIERLLRAHAVLDDTTRVFEDVDAALEWCETQVIAAPESRPLQSLGQLLSLKSQAHSRVLQGYFTKHRHAPGTLIFQQGDPGNSLYIIQSGCVTLHGPSGATRVRTPMLRRKRRSVFGRLRMLSSDNDGTQGGMAGVGVRAKSVGGAFSPTDRGVAKKLDLTSPCDDSSPPRKGSASSVFGELPDSKRRLAKIHEGAMFGDLNFFLQQPRTFSALVSGDHACTVFRLDRADYLRMQRDAPELCCAVQACLLKSISLLNAVTSNIL